MQKILTPLRKYIFITALSSISYHSFGQLTYGIQSGFQRNTVRSNHLETDWKSSYHVGIFGNYILNKRISITSNLLYSDKGFKFTDPEYYYFPDNKIVYHFRYLDLPVFLQYKALNKLSFLIGMQGSFLLSSHSIRGSTTINTIDYYGKRFDSGITAGLLFQINPYTSIQVRFTEGLTNVIRNNATLKVTSPPFYANVYASNFNYKDKNQVLQLSMSFLVNKLKKKVEKDIPESNKEPVISVGVKAGFNINKTTYKNFPINVPNDTHFSIGVHYGIYMKMKIFERLYFIPEIQGIVKGYLYKIYFPDYDETERLRIYYVEAPLIVSYPLHDFVSMEGGPVLGYSFLATSATRRSQYYPHQYEFGLTGGLRFKISNRFSVTSRYYKGLSNISHLYGNDYTKEYNKNIQISTYFKLKKN